MQRFARTGNMLRTGPTREATCSSDDSTKGILNSLEFLEVKFTEVIKERIAVVKSTAYKCIGYCS